MNVLPSRAFQDLTLICLWWLKPPVPCVTVLAWTTQHPGSTVRSPFRANQFCVPSFDYWTKSCNFCLYLLLCEASFWFSFFSLLVQHQSSLFRIWINDSSKHLFPFLLLAAVGWQSHPNNQCTYTDLESSVTAELLMCCLFGWNTFCALTVLRVWARSGAVVGKGGDGCLPPLENVSSLLQVARWKAAGCILSG